MASSRKASKPAFWERKPRLAAVALAAAIVVGLGVTLWFVVFSGLSSSADFIYSQF